MADPKSFHLDSRVHDYLVEHGAPPDSIGRGLIEQTRELGGIAGMQIAPEQGAFMTLFARIIGARRAIEVGTFTGYSALCIARGPRRRRKAHLLRRQRRVDAHRTSLLGKGRHRAQDRPAHRAGAGNPRVAARLARHRPGVHRCRQAELHRLLRSPAAPHADRWRDSGRQRAVAGSGRGPRHRRSADGRDPRVQRSRRRRRSRRVRHAAHLRRPDAAAQEDSGARRSPASLLDPSPTTSRRTPRNNGRATARPRAARRSVPAGHRAGWSATIGPQWLPASPKPSRRLCIGTSNKPCSARLASSDTIASSPPPRPPSPAVTNAPPSFPTSLPCIHSGAVRSKNWRMDDSMPPMCTPEPSRMPSADTTSSSGRLVARSHLDVRARGARAFGRRFGHASRAPGLRREDDQHLHDRRSLRIRMTELPQHRGEVGRIGAVRFDVLEARHRTRAACGAEPRSRSRHRRCRRRPEIPGARAKRGSGAGSRFAVALRPAWRHPVSRANASSSRRVGHRARVRLRPPPGRGPGR